MTGQWDTGFRKLFSGFLLFCLVGVAIAGDPPVSRHDFFRNFIEQQRGPSGARDSVPEDIESEPDFLADFVRAYHAFEARNLRPLGTSGESIDAGICKVEACGLDPEPGHEPHGQGGDPSIPGPPRLVSTHFPPGGLSIVWDAPVDASFASKTGAVSHYEVLVVQGSAFELFRTAGTQSFGRPARNLMMSVGVNEADGKVGNASRPVNHRARSQARRHFRFVSPVAENTRIAVRPVFRPDDSQQSAQGGGREQDGAGSGADTEFSPALLVPAGDHQRGLTQAPSDALEACIDDAVRNQGVTDRANLTVLDCSDEGITALDGLEALTSLQVLALDNNRLTDITPISMLPNLESLSLAFTDVANLDGLQGLITLKSLVISNNLVTDLAFVANLPDLEVLHAQNNQIQELPDLSATSLELLSLTGNPVSDIAGVIYADTLREVRLNDTVVSDITPLAENFNAPASQLELVDLRNVETIFCPQLDALTALMGTLEGDLQDPQASGGVGVMPPAGCKDIPTPVDLSTSVNPVVGYEFQVGWALGSADADPSEFLFEVEQQHETRSATQRHETDTGELAYLNRDSLPVGNNLIRVRACLPAVGQRDCGGWSLFLEIRVLADASAPASDAVGEIVDSGLRGCVNAHLVDGMLAGELTSLTCINAGIITLEGLDYFPNLDRVVLNQNAIVDVEAIEGLAALSSLQLAYNAISSQGLSHIAAGANGIYHELNLGSNQLSDVSALGGLDQATTLSLWGNAIADISPLADVSVTTLYAWSNQVSELPQLGSLDSLSLSHNQINTIPGLCKPQSADPDCLPGSSLADSLGFLELDHNPIVDDPNVIQRLSNASLLWWVNIANTGLSTLDFAVQWDSLQILDVSRNPVSDLAPLAGSTTLSSLDVSATDVQTLVALTDVPALTTLRLNDAFSLQSLQGIETFPALGTLELSGGSLDRVTGLAPLAETSLSTLYLEGTGVFNIADH